MTLIHCHSALAFSNNFARKAISKKIMKQLQVSANYFTAFVHTLSTGAA